MTVSVIIPLYNKVRHIQRAIHSVLTQTHQNFELIVVDDGSTDGSGDVVRQITDPRLRLITQNNVGVSAARNRGIQEANTELVAFLDADDEWMPTFLETVLGLRMRHPEAGMYATAYRLCDDKKTWRPAFTHCVTEPQGGLLEDYFQAAIGPAPVWSSAVMIPKHVFNEAGFFPVGVRRGEDLHMWARIALRYRVAWSPIHGAIYHLSSDNRACDALAIRTTADMASAPVIEEFLRSDRVFISSRRMVEEYLVSFRLMMAWDCHLNDKRDWAISLLKKTRGTKMFRRKRLLLLCLVLIPASVLKCGLAVKAFTRRTVLRLCNSGA